MIFHYEVPDESIFDMDKDVYNGELIPIDDILEDGAPCAELLATPPSKIQMTKGLERRKVTMMKMVKCRPGVVTMEKMPK